ncbi:MAG: hypothetical protein PHF63_13060, partial [Herbinix sp.]|nr:hypothetical protein [Herbinix sp.]
NQETNVTETKQINEQQEDKPMTKLLGKKTIAKDNEGNAIEFVYEVVNADDLITSHDTSLNANQNYPKELQPRERTRTASQMQVNDIVNNLQPEFLGENPRISDGAPIVGSDNIVESGNGRTIALTKMYQMKHGNSDKYINWLKDNAETFGINKDSLPENPVLVRRRLSEVNRMDFVKKANESSIATMSATETAKSDAEKLSINTLSLFMSNDNGIINTTENKNFIGKFIGEVVPKNEHNKYMTDRGELSQEGLARVKNAIFYKAYNDVNLMNKLSESLDNNTKNVTNALLGIAPKIVDIKNSIEKGELYNIDYSNDIAEAANEYIGLKETGKDVELYLQQESIFDNENTALIKDIIAIFNTNNRSVKKAMMVFNKLLDSVESLGNPNQINLFGEVETYNKVDVLEATLRRLEDEDNAQITLFQAKREESSGDIKEDKRKQTEKITDTATHSKEQNFTGEQSFKGSNAPTNSAVVDMNRPLVGVANIKNEIRKLFNISISDKTNKFNKRKALGFYKVMPEVIRTKYDNQLGVITHELGHHFDKQYDFNTKDTKLIQDMINKMDENFKKAYKPSELKGEAVAEFLRYYLTDTKTAREFGGEFYNLFENSLNKQDLKNIQTVRSDVLRWLNGEWEEQFDSTMVTVNEVKRKDLKSRINAEEINMMMFDDLIPLDRFSKVVEDTTGRKLSPEKNPYMLALMTRKNNAIVDGILQGKTVDTESNVINKDSLLSIVDETGKDINAFERYLKLKHALTLKNQGHQVLPDSIEVSKEKIELMEQQYPKFKEQSERLYKWYDTFFKAWVIDTNMLGKDSKKIYEKMREMYPYYVPMFRDKRSLTDGNVKTAGGKFTDQKSPVDRLSEKGSDTNTIRPIDGMITQVYRIVNAYTKNNVMRSIVENYNTVDGLGGFIDRVPPDMERNIVSTQGLKNTLESNFDGLLNPDDLEAIIDSIDDVLVGYNASSKSKDSDIVTVIAKDGSRQFYEVFDANLLKALTNMNSTQLDFTVKMIASIRRNVTGLTTGLNPVFGIASNFPRDIQQAYVFGSYKNPLEYGYETVKAMSEIIKGTDNYKSFMSSGGGYGASMIGADRKMADVVSRKLENKRNGVKVNPRNALDYAVEFIETFNDIIETAPRLAEFNKAYKEGKKQGMSDYNAKLNALYKSNDVTLNFLKHGTITNTAWGQMIPYFNAGLQGIDKLKRGLITEKGARAQTWTKAITTLTLPTILLWLYHRDDKDYERLSKGIKDNYWILWKNPDNSFFRIPKPKDLSVLFSADFERGLNAYFKEQGTEAFDGFFYTIQNALLPPMDTVFRPAIDVAKNKKWSGGKIVSTKLENLTKQNQYDDSTSRIGITLAKGISKVFPDWDIASPKNIDYLIDQYFGGLGDILLPLTTPNSYTPVEFIKRKFLADASYSNDAIDKFYELRDKTKKSNNSYEKNGSVDKYVDFTAEKELERYYKSISAY